jgi:lipopolysaccharide/colanic/teichoic acid biosynthesis glycosyltransferase
MSASRVNSVELAPTTIVAARREPRATAVACRVLDLVLASMLLVAMLPLLLAIAVAIRLDSPGRALFRQRRLGRNLKPFTVIKFRTMRAGTRDDSHREYMLQLISGNGTPRGEERPLFKLADDERVTRLGHVLRRSSLDELPQLWNVIVGDMSLVGPRPALAYEAERYPSEWLARFGVKPGLTGLWQVSGRSELNLPQAVALDIEYIERRSLWFNFGILARTIPAVLHRRGAA